MIKIRQVLLKFTCFQTSFRFVGWISGNMCDSRKISPLRQKATFLHGNETRDDMRVNISLETEAKLRLPGARPSDDSLEGDLRLTQSLRPERTDRCRKGLGRDGRLIYTATTWPSISRSKFQPNAGRSKEILSDGNRNSKCDLSPVKRQKISTFSS